MHRRLIRWGLPGALALALVASLGYLYFEQTKTSDPGLIKRPARILSDLENEPESTREDHPSSQASDGKKRDKVEKKQKEQSEEAAFERPPLPAPKESCDNLRVLVNQENQLPPDYAPRDLVSLRRYGVPVMPGRVRLRLEAAGQLSLLLRAATADGQELVVASAYRSHADQRRMFAEFESMYGKKAEVVSARPGQSQHQLGTAVDFTNADSDYRLLGRFGRSSASDWLLENGPKYGFVLAYPNSAEEETGIQWEPWHYRYIGVEHARRFEKSGMSLQSFLDRDGVRPRC